MFSDVCALLSVKDFQSTLVELLSLFPFASVVSALPASFEICIIPEIVFVGIDEVVYPIFTAAIEREVKSLSCSVLKLASTSI